MNSRLEFGSIITNNTVPEHLFGVELKKITRKKLRIKFFLIIYLIPLEYRKFDLEKMAIEECASPTLNFGEMQKKCEILTGKVTCTLKFKCASKNLSAIQKNVCKNFF